MLFNVLAVLGIAVFVGLIVCSRRAYYASEGILERYQGIFGKRTANALILAIYVGICEIIAVITIFVLRIMGESEEYISSMLPMVAGGLIWIVVFGVIAFFSVMRAKNKCPDELKTELMKSILIVGMGTVFRVIIISWNMSCALVSLIPFMGWMENLKISKKY